MKPLAYFGGLIFTYIWIMAVFSGCASTPFQTTTIPKVIIRYDCNVEQTDKDSLYNAIINNASCNVTEPIYITVKTYHKPEPIAQFVGWPYKSFHILGSVTYKNITKNIKGQVSNPGILTSSILAGVPGLIIGSANLTRDMKSAENAFAISAWKYIRNIKANMNKTYTTLFIGIILTLINALLWAYCGYPESKKMIKLNLSISTLFLIILILLT